jgi:tol-pal system protein YbgF
MKKINYIKCGLLCLVLMGFLSGAAWAESSAALSERVQTLERTSEKNNQDVAQAMNLLTQIQQEFQSIRGQVDASHYLDQENDRVYRDLDLRVSSLEDKIDQIQRLFKEMVDNQKGGQAVKTPASAKEYDDFQNLLLMVNSRDYRGAASGFLGFLKKYPNSPYAAQARYWTGESFYSMGDYARSIQEFQQLAQDFPQDPRVKEAIFKQGLAFSRLQKNTEAKLFFQKVMATYPNTAEAAKAQSRLHWIEETEKNQVALGQASTSGQGTTPPAKTETTPSAQGSANRPITKISPYPKPKTNTPPAPPPAPVPETAPTQNKSGEEGNRPENTGGTNQPPLF